MTVNVKVTVVKLPPLPKVISHSPVIITNGISITTTNNEPLIIVMPDVPLNEVHIYIHSLIRAPRAPNVMERLFEENRSPRFYYSVA